jgi:DNA mismatch repair ATPase MutS
VLNSFCLSPDMVEQLINNSSGRKSLYETSLRKIGDLESLSIKLADKRAGLVDLYKIYSAVKEVEKMAEIFRQMKTDDKDILNEHFGVPFVKKLDKMEKFQVQVRLG